MKTFIHLRLLLFISLGFPIKGYGQSQLSGKVEGSDGIPLPFANVLLLSAGDSSLVKGMVTSEMGTYQINGVKPGGYLLLASMVGYKKVYFTTLAREISLVKYAP
jgi:hypothetical protein